MDEIKKVAYPPGAQTIKLLNLKKENTPMKECFKKLTGYKLLAEVIDINIKYIDGGREAAA